MHHKIKFKYIQKNYCFQFVQQPWILCFGRFGKPSPTDRAPRRDRAITPVQTRYRSTTGSYRWCISRPHPPGNSTGFPSTFSCKFWKFSAREKRRGWEPFANHGNFWCRIIGSGCIFCSINRSPGTLFFSPKLTCVPVILSSTIQSSFFPIQYASNFCYLVNSDN